jgi:diguanylate cyclase (GGDEF)-like protein
MTTEQPSPATAADVAAAQADVRRGARGFVRALCQMVFVTSGVGGLVAAVLLDQPVAATAAICAVAAVVVGLPLALVFRAGATKRGLAIGVENATKGRLLEEDARRREFETKLARALEMAEDEDSAYGVAQRALERIMPDHRVELLLADNSHAHLEQALVTGAAGTAGEAVPGCRVDSPKRCVAVRRAVTQVFPDSEELDVCPYLRDRAGGGCSAVCVPVSMMGQSVGVLHALGTREQSIDDQTVQALQVLADQSGQRVGLLRMLAETQLQAMTDGLTGLLNRRSFENRARALQRSGTVFSVVIADLDHFKLLNDKYGHESGDRALRLFAESLRDAVRDEDSACRYGGEEFVVLLPRAEVYEAIEVADRIRERLGEASGRGDVPRFTASFGIAHSSDAADLEDLVRRADGALFAAKHAGRDRICIDGHETSVADNLTAGTR